ncbi:coproporphyrinogen III oxidase [Clostridia bacterium]|nr:coproporphyrinogen III oxidase [Clostridia bacterium]
MNIYIQNHKYHYEIENLTRVFFPNSKLKIIKEFCGEPEKPFILTSVDESDDISNIKVKIELYDFSKELQLQLSNKITDFTNTCERAMAQLLFNLLQEYTGLTPPWGILTGVRPIKLFRSLCESQGLEETKKYLTEELFVTPEKTNLAAITEANERAILSVSKPQSYSLYVSIPFCPSRCSYCSFVSQSIEKAQKLIEPYVELLCKELAHTAKIAADLHLQLETVYIGGGTPTTLSALQLKKLIESINLHYPMKNCKEFTVEAGRPDTITTEKLKAILDGGADRISINPQTLNDGILEAIGRNHTAAETITAFNLAREVGFKHINMDLIAGLPRESVQSFENTLHKIIELNPESITLHTLAMKKASALTEQGMSLYRKDAENTSKMHSICNNRLEQNGYRPYYLYRQSRMVGNLENIGYAKKGKDGLYNVFVMDETHTILGCGAGAVTKLKNPYTGYLERIFNYKYPYEYINGFMEILTRKDRCYSFYSQIGH